MKKNEKIKNVKKNKEDSKLIDNITLANSKEAKEVISDKEMKEEDIIVETIDTDNIINLIGKKEPVSNDIVGAIRGLSSTLLSLNRVLISLEKKLNSGGQKSSGGFRRNNGRQSFGGGGRSNYHRSDNHRDHHRSDNHRPERDRSNNSFSDNRNRDKNKNSFDYNKK